MSSEAQLPQPGEVVDGKYRVESLLGKGGMGAVFVVRHTQTQRPFALKCMLADLIGDYEAEQRFIREAKLSGNVGHSGVVATYDIGRHRGCLYMVMELLSGEPLSTRLTRGALSIGEATHLMITVLDAVAAAHQQGIVHRDLKPDNIFLHRGPGGGAYEPKILDFGISKALSPDGQPTLGLTKTGAMLGTPLYMSPEQVRASRDINQRTDIYALGVIAYQLLTGTVPFDGSGFAELVLKIVTGETVPPSSRNSSIPPGLDAVVMRAMSVEPEQRFADAKSFARALAPFAVAPVYASQRPSALSSTPPASMNVSVPPAARVPSVTPQSLTPFAAEARVSVPVKPVPWIAIAAGAAALGLVAWLWLSGDASEVVADPGSTLPASAAAATQPSVASVAPPQPVAPQVIVKEPEPVVVAPAVVAAPVVAEPETPRHVAPAAAAPETVAPAHRHARQPHVEPVAHPSSPSSSMTPTPAFTSSPPAAVPAAQPERQRGPRPSDQIIDPFAD